MATSPWSVLAPPGLLLPVKVVLEVSQSGMCTPAHEAQAVHTCTHVICHGELSLLFLEQHRCECSLLMIKSIEIMLMSDT